MEQREGEIIKKRNLFLASEEAICFISRRIRKTTLCLTMMSLDYDMTTLGFSTMIHAPSNKSSTNYLIQCLT